MRGTTSPQILVPPVNRASMPNSKTTLALIAATMLIATSAFASDIGSIINNKPGQDNFQIIGINQLAKLMANPKSHVHVYDADGPGVRDSEGMILGARPLTSDDRYNVAEELPTNKRAKLVFYCHNPH
jgi:hypothetical protein